MTTKKYDPLAIKIRNDIWQDLCGRKGYDLGCLDVGIQNEIRDAWDAAIMKRIKPLLEAKFRLEELDK